VRALLGVLLAAAAGSTALPASAAAATQPCRAEGSECLLLTVPLDRSGGVPGTVRLRVERTPATRPVRPPLLVLAGHPGDSSRLIVGDGARYVLAGETRARDVVVMDLRGTGRSGALRCPWLERASGSRVTEAAAACARSLGPRRGFFTASDSAADVEAVRQAIGAEKIALLGSSHGAQVAFAYAQRYPSRVDRLALASIPGPHGFDALYRAGFAAVPEAVQVLCRKDRCQRASRDPLADVMALARHLERVPLSGTVNDKFGNPRRAGIEAFDLFEALRWAVDGDRAVMGYIRNALRGDPKPLLRHRRQIAASAARPSWSSAAAHAASRCEESLLPWSRAVPLGERGHTAMTFSQSLDAGALLPFGPRAALGSDVIALCRSWPMASPAPLPPRVLPPIPTLIVAGVDDMLAPVSVAREVADLIPGSRLLRLRGAGSDGFGWNGGGSSCARQVLRAFLAGAMPKDVCGPEWKPDRGASEPPPLALKEVSPDPRVSGRAGRTLTAVNATIRDGGAMVQEQLFRRFAELRGSPRGEWARIMSAPSRTGGLRTGSYTLSLRDHRLVLRGASYVPGVRVSGWVLFADEPAQRRGVLRVGGPGVARGRLVLSRGGMSGSLGGHPVRAPTRWGPELGFTVANGY